MANSNLIDIDLLQNRMCDAGADAAASKGSSSSSWEAKEITLEDVASKIPNGSSCYIGSCGSSPEATLKAMVDDYLLADIQVLQGLPGGNLPHLSEHMDRFRTSSTFAMTRTSYYQPGGDSSSSSGNSRSAQREGLADYMPVSFASVPRLMEEGQIKVDVAIIKVTPPHKNFVSLGMGVECTREAIHHADIVIAEVNSNMPWTEGHSKIHVSRIDWWIRRDEPLLTTVQLWPQYIKMKGYEKLVLDGIGRNVIKEIPNGATLKFGWSPLTYCVYPFLRERSDLGIHTDVLTESIVRLMEEGVINNTKKTIDTGRTVASQAHGTTETYDFLDRNPAVEFHPTRYVDDPQVMARIHNLIAIVGALKVDVTGQVATDSIAHKFYGGVWSDDDSLRGARFSPGGKPIVVVPSKSIQGRSNILFQLPPGTGVSITRSDVEYIVTEYGTAYVYGKSIRERCLALINIAHPDFRTELLEECKQHYYISRYQPGHSFKSQYPDHLECYHRTKRTDKECFVRPIKAIDEDRLRNFFHKLSDHSVYLRYFRILRSMPQRILRKTADVDYSTDMALVVLYPSRSPKNQEIVAIGQWVSDKPTPAGNGKNNNGNGSHSSSIPEVAFQVRDDWQGEGLGKFLFLKLIEIARELGLPQLKADVLADNKAMQGVFKSSGIPYLTRYDFGVITYYFDIEHKVVATPLEQQQQQQQQPQDAPEPKTMEEG